MYGNEGVRRFWRWFGGQSVQLKSLIHATAEPGWAIEGPSLGAVAQAVDARLAECFPGVRAEYALGRDRACVVTFTTGGDADLFERVFDLVDGAPILPGWEFQALRPRRTPAQFEAFGARYALGDLRFSYRLGSEKIIVAILTDGEPLCDYRTRRAYAAALVAELLGEEDFGSHVSDVVMLTYETWLAATPGGRSSPVAALPQTFDRIFRRPRSLRRPAVTTHLRLVG